MFSSETVVPKIANGINELDNMKSTNVHILVLTKQMELLIKSLTDGANAVVVNSVCES